MGTTLLRCPDVHILKIPPRAAEESAIPADPLHLIVLPSESFPAVAARIVATALELAVDQRGQCTLALTGGTTPAPVYQELARQAEIPWNQIEIFFGDERAVPPTDPASNYRMARETLLDHVPVSHAHIHRMRAEDPDREPAADDYAKRLPSALDVLLLGMGADGHTASLFPGVNALGEAGRRVVPVEGPTSPFHRMTITPPVILAARSIYVLVTGSAKAATLARVLEGPENPMVLPAQLARRGTWIVDAPAASLLQHSGE